MRNNEMLEGNSNSKFTEEQILKIYMAAIEQSSSALCFFLKTRRLKSAWKQ